MKGMPLENAVKARKQISIHSTSSRDCAKFSGGDCYFTTRRTGRERFASMSVVNTNGKGKTSAVGEAGAPSGKWFLPCITLR